MEIPRRGAAAVRRHARPRIPDEGRLFLRHRCAGARQSYNKMFVAYLRTFARMGLKAIPMRADTGPIGGDLSHEFIILADTGEIRRVLRQTMAHRRCRVLRRGLCARSRSRSSTPARISMPRPTKSTIANRSRRRTRRFGRRAAASRSAISSISAPNIRKPMNARRRRARWRPGPGRDGLVRHRRIAAGRRDHRGEP